MSLDSAPAIEQTLLVNGSDPCQHQRILMQTRFMATFLQVGSDLQWHLTFRVSAWNRLLTDIRMGAACWTAVSTWMTNGWAGSSKTCSHQLCILGQPQNPVSHIPSTQVKSTLTSRHMPSNVLGGPLI